MKYRLSTFVSMMSIAVMTLFSIGCEKTPDKPGENPGGEDKGEFTLTYETPSLTMTPSGSDLIIKAPVHTGAIPYSFMFSGITKDGNVFTDEKENFGIAADNGQIFIKNTAELPLGDYRISVSCMSDKVEYNYPDVISVKVIALLENIVKVTPSEYSIALEDILAEGFVSPEFKVELTEEREGAILSISSVSTSSGEAVNPTAYFSMMGDVITIKAVEIPSEVYSINIGVKTENDEGIAEGALTVSVTAPPYELIYSPAVVEAKEKQEAKTSTPTVKGNRNGLAYSFASVAKLDGESRIPVANEWIGTLFTIDEETGMVKVDPKVMGETSIAGSYSIGILVRNADCEDGVLFENALTVKIEKYVAPVTEFSYPSKENTTYAVKEVKGQVIKAVVNADAERPLSFTWSVTGTDKSNFTLDEATGNITIAEALPRGTYTISVTVNNAADQKKTAKIEIEVYDPLYFTYFSYGNNFGLAEGSEAAKAAGDVSQFRYSENCAETKLAVVKSDFANGANVTWTVRNVVQSTATIDEATGELTVTTSAGTENQIALVFVTASTGTEEEGGVTVTLPVFFHITAGTVKIEYTPFVLRVNPVIGGRSVAPVITGVDPAKYYMDYRRTFNYYNIDGKYENGNGLEEGQPSKNPSFMQHIWYSWWHADGKMNSGSKDPVSYYTNLKTDLANALLYVDNGEVDRHSIVVNPNKWIANRYSSTDNKGNAISNDNGIGVADGVFTGQITHGANEGTVSNGTKVFNFFVWFDKDYEPAK